MKKRKYSILTVILVGVMCLMAGALISTSVLNKMSDYNNVMLMLDTQSGEINLLEKRLDELELAEKPDTDAINSEVAAEKESTTATSQGEIVWKTKSGKKYHKENCGSLSKSSIAISLEEATAAGLEPCKRCFK